MASLAGYWRQGRIYRSKAGFGTTGRAKVPVGVFAQLDYFLFATTHSESGNQIRAARGLYGQVQRNPSGKEVTFCHAPATFPADEKLHLAKADQNHMS